jgi:phosphopantetheinyl transferase
LRSTLKMAASGTAKLRQILSPNERQRVDRFYLEVGRRRCIVGRRVLGLLLGQILGLSANQLQFKVAHSGDLILIAITMGRAVGVDVERIPARAAFSKRRADMDAPPKRGAC